MRRIYLSTDVVNCHIDFQVQGVRVDLVVATDATVKVALKEVVHEAELAECVATAQSNWFDVHLEAEGALQLSVEELLLDVPDVARLGAEAIVVGSLVHCSFNPSVYRGVGVVAPFQIIDHFLILHVVNGLRFKTHIWLDLLILVLVECLDKPCLPRFVLTGLNFHELCWLEVLTWCRHPFYLKSFFRVFRRLDPSEKEPGLLVVVEVGRKQALRG
jgi:hypothetical protein